MQHRKEVAVRNTGIEVNAFMKQYEQQHKKPLPTEGMVAYTPKEYATLKRKHINTIQAMLKAGEIPNAEKFGGRWLIYLPIDNSISLEEYQKILDENIKLKALLDGISRMSKY